MKSAMSVYRQQTKAGHSDEDQDSEARVQSKERVKQSEGCVNSQRQEQRKKAGNRSRATAAGRQRPKGKRSSGAASATRSAALSPTRRGAGLRLPSERPRGQAQPSTELCRRGCRFASSSRRAAPSPVPCRGLSSASAPGPPHPASARPRLQQRCR